MGLHGAKPGAAAKEKRPKKTLHPFMRRMPLIAPQPIPFSPLGRWNGNMPETVAVWNRVGTYRIT
jgi:hypothetical protein